MQQINYRPRLDSPMFTSKPFNDVLHQLDYNNESNRFKRNLANWAYQFGYLLNEKTVIMVPKDNFKVAKISLAEVFLHIKAVGVFEETNQVSFLPNSNIIFVEFESAEIRANFMSWTKIIAGYDIHFLTNDDRNDSCKIYIDKAPFSMLVDELPLALKNWGIVQEMIPDKVAKGNGHFITTGQTVIHFKFTGNKSLQELPYFVKIRATKLYLHVPARPKICFRCEETSHLISACTKRYCVKCRSIQVVGHTCIETYATKLTPSSATWHANLQKEMDDSNLTNMDSNSFSSEPISRSGVSSRPTTVSDTVIDSVQDPPLINLIQPAITVGNKNDLVTPIPYVNFGLSGLKSDTEFPCIVSNSDKQIDLWAANNNKSPEVELKKKEVHKRPDSHDNSQSKRKKTRSGKTSKDLSTVHNTSSKSYSLRSSSNNEGIGLTDKSIKFQDSSGSESISVNLDEEVLNSDSKEGSEDESLNEGVNEDTTD